MIVLEGFAVPYDTWCWHEHYPAFSSFARGSFAQAIAGGLVFVGLVVMSIVSITGRKLFSWPVPGDVEMLQDLVIAAVNQAVRGAQQQMADEMSKLTGGLKIPGLS